MKKTMLAVLAGMATTTVAQDVTFTARVFDNSLSGGTAMDPYKDIDAFSSATTSFLVGNNPISIAYDGANVYIGGNVNGSPAQISIAEISDFFGAAGAKAVPGSEIIQATDPIGGGRGWTGMDWSDDFGLIASLDRGSAADPDDQIFRWQRNAPTDFSQTLQVSIPGLRGVSGICYDYGFDGSGFLLSDATMGPAVVVPEHGRGGPWGIDPITMAGADDIYTPDSAFYSIFVSGDQGTAWRDYDIHPTNGLVVGRTNNIAVVGDRNNGNGTDNLRLITPPGGLGLFTTNQNVEIIHNPACGVDMIVMNDRPTSGTFLDLPTAVRLYDTAGNELTYAVEFPDGTPVTFANTSTFYSFFWDEAQQLLFICDGTNRDIYALELSCHAGCPCDLTGNGLLNLDDIDAFVAAFLGGDLAADFDGNGTVNIDDIDAFIACFLGGCP
ncbi:MAG: GC-type dockerin domain-anchored protein [Phycisphaerales bacterium]